MDIESAVLKEGVGTKEHAPEGPNKRRRVPTQTRCNGDAYRVSETDSATNRESATTSLLVVDERAIGHVGDERPGVGDQHPRIEIRAEVAKQSATQHGQAEAALYVDKNNNVST